MPHIALPEGLSGINSGFACCPESVVDLAIRGAFRQCAFDIGGHWTPAFAIHLGRFTHGVLRPTISAGSASAATGNTHR